MFFLRHDRPVITDEVYDTMTDDDWHRLDEALERQNDAYCAYADSIRERLPRRSFPAYGAWYFNNSEHRGPHDATIESMTLSEARRGKNRRLRDIIITLRLTSCFEDAVMAVTFKGVQSYSMSLPVEFNKADPVQRSGHGDWLDYELRISERGLPVLEADFSTGGHWLIECKDIAYRLEPLEPTVKRTP